REDLEGHHVRIMDFHNNSIAGKKLMLDRTIVSFLEYIFRDQVVAMQTLTYKYSSQQGAHQDYAYVVAEIPSHLAASWIALEDVHPDAGPLAYYPGSHGIRKFNFGKGFVWTPESSPDGHVKFSEHILSECRRMGLKEQLFLPKKGDVFIWHAAL